MRHVIVGTGVAGIAAIEAIRSLSNDVQVGKNSVDEIYLIGEDPHGCKTTSPEPPTPLPIREAHVANVAKPSGWS